MCIYLYKYVYLLPFGPIHHRIVADHSMGYGLAEVSVFDRQEGAADSLYGAFFDAAPNLQGMFRVPWRKKPPIF